MSNKTTQRLQVYLSHQGVCSRRKAMEVILAGRVTVNGQLTKEPSCPVLAGQDEICVDGKPIRAKTYEYILLNKPEGYVTTREDRFAQKTVIDLLPAHLRHLNPVGRLDKNTEGLLLLTNDGDLANHLTHPRYDVDKVYVVQIQKRLTPKDQQQLESGVKIEGEVTAPAKIRDVRSLKQGTEFIITIHEGRKRQIRLMMAKVGHYVTYLKRIQQGPLKLGALPTGKFRELTKDEVLKLKNTNQ